MAALTDHDTTEGHDEANARAQARGVRFIGGIELTTYGGGRVVHVLGLRVRSTDDLAFTNANARDVWDRNQHRWIETLTRSGVAVSWERDFTDHPVRLPVLVERLCRRGFADGDPSKVHAAFRAFFAALPAEAYAKLPSPAQGAAVIRASGGLALLAHPADLAEEGLAQRWLDDVDGIEADYLRYDPDTRAKLRALATGRGKLYSSGSDWHGYFQGEYQNPRFEALPELFALLRG